MKHYSFVLPFITQVRVCRRQFHLFFSIDCTVRYTNSAQTESACAGALGVQLAGPATYFGEYYDKPTIGDAARAIEPKDILRANRMMRVASVLGLIAATGIRLMIGV